MTTIKKLMKIVDHIRSLPNKAEKLKYLNEQDHTILHFLSKNIKKDGIAKAIASEIVEIKASVSSMEKIIEVFEGASNESSRKKKIRWIHSILLSKEDKEFVLTTLYGSLKLGITIPTPDPEFGDVIKPQLCGTGIEFNPSQVIIEEKFDGIRCIATKKDDKVTLQSRNGKVLDVPALIKPLYNVMENGTIFDGEIVAFDGKFESLDRKSNNLIYQIFDILFYEGKSIIDYSLITRKELLHINYHEYIKGNKHIKISQELNFSSMIDINDWITAFDVEGIVAKDPESTYKYGDRKDWIKWKLFQECDCKVIGYEMGQGKRSETIGAIQVIPIGSDTISSVGSGFNDDQLNHMKELLDNNKKVIINVKYQNLTQNKCLRFPIFLRIREINGDEI